MASGTKRCPACAEEIQAAAVKCRFCGEYFRPTSGLTAPPIPPVPLSEPQTASRRVFAWIAFLGIAGTILTAILVWIALRPAIPEFVQDYRPGDRGVLLSAGLYRRGRHGWDDAKTIPMFASAGDYPTIYGALCREGYDKEGLRHMQTLGEMFNAGRLLSGYPGDQMEVVEAGSPCVRIRLIDGVNAGTVGWVRAEHCGIDLAKRR